MVKTFKSEEFGYEVELGRLASQADGAAWLKQGGTVVLATVVSSPSADFPGFLPLTTDYRELFSAAGKIPGGYYKREGKFTDKEVLTSRLIDRAIRPLFPVNYFDQLQVLVTVYSVDKEHPPHILAFLAASIALSTSKVPFLGPVGIVEIARSSEGVIIFNPTHTQSKDSSLRIIVAGTAEGICMVEGTADQISEQQFIDLMFEAHEIIKRQVAWQQEVITAIKPHKQEIVDLIDWREWEKRSHDFLTMDHVKSTFVADKVERALAVELVNDAFKLHYKAELDLMGPALVRAVLYVFDQVLKEKVTTLITQTRKRIDGRAFDQVRAIDVEVGLLPFTHGSSLFVRGRTQALISITLGGGQDEQKVDDLMGATLEKSFMLHYNFAPFSVGEVRPMRGPSRREVGHGYLAASAIERVLPDKEKFPYTIRVVADMLESDGSTSMATVCGGIMGLMNAGVPIKAMVGGVAMGLLRAENGEFYALTDINGFEDAYGLMDFKVAGTKNGITAIQMDIKYKGGLPRQVFVAALKQAFDGRLHILSCMERVMSQPNPKLSDLVPQFVSFRIAPDRIGAVIGSGGKTIKDIIARTGTTIDVEDDGLVKVFGQPGEKLDQAVSWVKILGGLVERNSIHRGKIKRVAEFGIFVEIAPGQDGLVHISMIPKKEQPMMAQIYKIDDQVVVEVIDYDESTGRIRLKIVSPNE